jgi:hypothetical protein
LPGRLCAVIRGKYEFNSALADAFENGCQVADGRIRFPDHAVHVNDEGFYV